MFLQYRLTNKLLRSLVLNQEQFCDVLQANYDYYLASNVPESFRKIYNLHSKQILYDLSNSGTLEEMCNLFLSYLSVIL